MTKKKISKFKLGERIAYLRKQRQIQQSELAKSAFITQSMLSQIEAGSKSPSIEVLTDIAGALDISVAVLFVEDDVHVFDLAKIHRKYKKKKDLPDTLYRAFHDVLELAQKLGF
jgi:transcriptional regulator with XRE-family HTH domain